MITNIATTGNGAASLITAPGEYAHEVQGTWGSTTITIEQLPAGAAAWKAVQDETGTAISLTANSKRFITTFGAGDKVRPVATGGSGINLNFSLVPAGPGTLEPRAA